MTSEADEEGIDLFQEPDDFYEPEKQPSFASHQLLSGQKVTVRLVGHNPLWVSCSRTVISISTLFFAALSF
jgi:nicotinamide N-methyltransferase